MLQFVQPLQLLVVMETVCVVEEEPLEVVLSTQSVDILVLLVEDTQTQLVEHIQQSQVDTIVQHQVLDHLLGVVV